MHDHRRRQRGQAMIFCALATLALILFVILGSDYGLVVAADTDLVTYAQEVARAGVENATTIANFSTVGVAQLDPQRARPEAQQFFASLGLDQTYQLTILEATTTRLTVQITHVQPLFFWPDVKLSEQATATPQYGF